MKKTTVKRIITTILAVATVGSTAALFAGCGEKSPEEKAKDAISDMYNKYKNAADESSEEEEKETVELNLLDKIVSDKLYTLKLYVDNGNRDKNNSGFYIQINDAIDIDGYTVELSEKQDEYDFSYIGYSGNWDIKKDGEKLAKFTMTRHTEVVDSDEIENDKMVVSISAYDPDSEENSDVEFKFTETKRDEIEIDLPAELTPDECKQHMDELKAAASPELEKVPYYSDDCENTKLESVYYFPDDDTKPGEASRVFFLYSADVRFMTSYRKEYFVITIDHPFFFDGELHGLIINHIYIGEIAMNSTLEKELANCGFDLSKGTKIG